VTPKTTQQNLLYWAGALALAVVLSFLSAIAINWPAGGSVDWRAVALAVIATVVSLSPIVAAGLGLPMLGKEQQAYLSHQVGQTAATAALEQAAVGQVTTAAVTPDQVAVLVADELERRMKAEPTEVKP
jgi:thiamine transporter ThiT